MPRIRSLKMVADTPSVIFGLLAPRSKSTMLVLLANLIPKKGVMNHSADAATGSTTANATANAMMRTRVRTAYLRSEKVRGRAAKR